MTLPISDSVTGIVARKEGIPFTSSPSERAACPFGVSASFRQSMCHRLKNRILWAYEGVEFGHWLRKVDCLRSSGNGGTNATFALVGLPQIGPWVPPERRVVSAVHRTLGRSGWDFAGP